MAFTTATDVTSYTTAARAFLAEIAHQHGPALDGGAAQARCEDEGHRAYPAGRNPYVAGSPAAVWWSIGWHRADAAACPEMQA